jgi:Ca2+-binding RTX toxin-like protein
VTYHWLLDGEEKSIDPFYTLTQEDVGKNISLFASYTDRSGYTETTDKTAVLRVTNVNDPPTGTLSILVNGKLPNAQKAAQKDTLEVKNTLNDTDGIGTDKDGKPIFTYQWLRDGAAIAGETGETHILTQADVNKIISFKASYIDLQGKKEDVISAGLSIDNVNDSPTGAVYITGVSNLGRTLSAAPQLIDLDGLGEMSYQWFRGETSITGATLSNYTLTQDDLKMQMRVTVAYTDGFGNQETASSQKMPLAVSISTKTTIGSDRITGTSKAEKITGLSGDDTLIGGLGNDTLTGGLGNDVFLFNTEKEMNKDTIVDFKTGQDKIDISNMDGDMKTAGKQGFTFIGNDAPFVKNDAIGKLRFDSQKHILYGSNDADIQPEFSIVLTGVDSLKSSDFIFIITPAS